MLSDRPFTSSRADGDLVVGIDDLVSECQRRLKLGSNLLVHGPAGAGKTTLVNQVVATMAVQRVGPVDSLESLAVALDPTRPMADMIEADVADRMARLAQSGIKVIVVDDPGPGPLASSFGALRDVWWASPIKWIVLVRPAEVAPWTARPVDTFFDLIEMQPLSPTDAATLLLRRADRMADRYGDAETADTLRAIAPAVIAATDRRPRSLIQAARTGLATADPHAWAAAATASVTTADRISDTHRAVVQHLRVNGPTSASDQELQDFIGVTRGRIAQLLSDLDDRGLVNRHRDGRRILYSLREETAR